MTASDNAFIELLRRGLDGKTPDSSLFRDLSHEEWESVYDMAKRQTVCGTCYDSLCRLPDALLPAGSLLPRWVARVNAIETRNSQMRAALTELISLFAEAGLHPVVQKGLSVARFYAAPDTRESGDIDLWLPGKELNDAVSLVSGLGCAPVTHPDGSISLVYKGFVVEFHRTLISISNPFVSDHLDTYVRRSCEKQTGDRNPIPSPPAILELLLLDVHIMRHAFGNGIGLRQICDYVLASRALHGKYDRKEFADLSRELGISRWTALLNEYAVYCLDADPDFLPPSGLKGSRKPSVRKLHDIVTKGGNFGQHIKSHRHDPAKTGKTKLHTLSMLARRSRFAVSIAPSEAFWNFIKLMIGQLHTIVL